jgi:hypothetical protein
MKDYSLFPKFISMDLPNEAKYTFLGFLLVKILKVRLIRKISAIFSLLLANSKYKEKDFIIFL